VAFAGSALGFAFRGGSIARGSIARRNDGEIPLVDDDDTERPDSSA